MAPQSRIVRLSGANRAPGTYHRQTGQGLDAGYLPISRDLTYKPAVPADQPFSEYLRQRRDRGHGTTAERPRRGELAAAKSATRRAEAHAG